MQTPEEIKIGLELCQSYMGGADERECCDVCGYQGGCNDLMPDTLAYIQQLERERDAAVADIHKTCSTCKHYYYNRQDDDTADCLWFDGCKSEDHWEWRGVKEAAP